MEAIRTGDPRARDLEITYAAEYTRYAADIPLPTVIVGDAPESEDIAFDDIPIEVIEIVSVSESDS